MNPFNNFQWPTRCANNLVLSCSKIAHPKVGRGIFAGKGEFIAPFYGALVYEIPNLTIPVSQIHGEGIYALTNAECNTFSIDTDLKNLNERTRILNMFINPVSFSAARYVNDPRYFEGDADTSAHMQEGFMRKANVEVC